MTCTEFNEWKDPMASEERGDSGEKTLHKKQLFQLVTMMVGEEETSRIRGSRIIASIRKAMDPPEFGELPTNHSCAL